MMELKLKQMNNIKVIALDICDMCGSPYIESHSKEIEITINEYIKQECIEFGEWVFDINGGLAVATISDGIKLNIPQLYEIYLQSKTKQ